MSVPKPLKGKVGVGSTVYLSDDRILFIAGDYTPYAGQVKDGVVVISCQSPLAQKLIDQGVGGNVVGRSATRIIAIE